jgi:hypothetical protein
VSDEGFNDGCYLLLAAREASALMYSRIFAALFMGVTLAAQVGTFQDPRTHVETRKLLSSLGDVKNDREALAALFKKGYDRIDDLIEALHDPDREIGLRAQIVIRYLGNETGMKALENWYSKQDEIPISGPIPLPLTERDYKFINDQFVTKPTVTWGSAEKYIYALALDRSPRARAVLKEVMKREGTTDDGSAAGHALRRVKVSHPEKMLTGRSGLAKLVLRNAFFISPISRPYTSARLLGLNARKDKALVEVYINPGPLAEEWYHVVISKHGRGWKFFSITQVAVS